MPVNYDGSPGAADLASDTAGTGDVAYLIVQLGTHAARLFAQRLSPLGLEPRHAGLLLCLAASEGRSQQAIAELIGLSPTRMVFCVDELEQRGLVRRQRNDADRRSYALCLTDSGRELVGQLRAVTRQHSGDLSGSLDATERAQLAVLLGKLAAAHGIAAQHLPC